MTEQTVRLSVGQAIVRYLTHQYTERDGVEPLHTRSLWDLRPWKCYWFGPGAFAE